MAWEVRMGAGAPAGRRVARKRVGALTHHAVSLAVAALFVVPLLWIVVGSLRQTGLPPPRTVEWWPQPAAWEYYRRVFRVVPLALYARNSFLVVPLTVPLTIITASWAW